MTQASNIKDLKIPDFYKTGLGASNAELLGLSQGSLAHDIFIRAEKIRAALILISQNLPDDDKRDLLREGNKLIFYVIDAISGNISRSDFLKQIKATVIKINELIDFYYLNSFLSEHNANIIKRGLLSFSNLAGNLDTVNLDPEKQLTEEDLLSVEDALHSATVPAEPELSEQEDKRQNKRHTKGQNKRHGSQKTKDERKPRARFRSIKEEAQKHSRRVQILDILKTTPWLTSSEILDSLPNSDKVSIKTLQRELTKMLEEKLIQKDGEKRWTRYSIK